MLILSVILGLGSFVPAHAQPAAGRAPEMVQPVTTPEKKANPMQIISIQQALYQAITRDKSPDTVALLIRQNMDATGRPCPQVVAYQVFRYNTGSRTLKVKCSRHALYALTVTHAGHAQTMGGDGSIGDMLPSDGRVYSVFGEKLQSYVSQEKLRSAQADNTPIAVTPAAAPAPALRPIPWTWIYPLPILLGLFLLYKLLFARRSNLEHSWAINSADKDYMMDESTEVYPNVFRHPRGFFIARGKRGKRRLFGNALAAMLYRDLGIKIGEIGE